MVQPVDAAILSDGVLAGQKLALSRALTQIENETPIGKAVLEELFPHTGKAHLVGITGPPGTGKSSLVNELALAYRNPQVGESSRVAIVAVDPTSPFSGGAILGDRIRMRGLAGDPGVFIRSMASRGSLGGLATTTSGIVLALDAAGFDVILIETVGVGQAEVDIMRLSHTTVVIEAPGLGDEIQAIKAGLLEIADILVVNKADKPGAETTERALRSMLQMTIELAKNTREIDVEAHEIIKGPVDSRQQEFEKWITPIIQTVAIDGEGVVELKSAITDHFNYLLMTKGKSKREETMLRYELSLLLREALVSRLRSAIPDEEYELIIAQLLKREISPWKAVDKLIRGDQR